MNKIVFNENDAKLDSIVLNAVRSYPRGTRDSKTIDSKIYYEVFKKVVENYVNINPAAHQEFIDTYNAVIPKYSIKLTKKDANKLFNKYIIPATSHAATGNRSAAVITYRGLLDKLKKIAVGRTIGMNISCEKQKVKIKSLKKEEAV